MLGSSIVIEEWRYLANTDTHNSQDLVIDYMCISKSHLFRPMV
jgi:hypothetical protein